MARRSTLPWLAVGPIVAACDGGARPTEVPRPDPAPAAVAQAPAAAPATQGAGAPAGDRAAGSCCGSPMCRGAGPAGCGCRKGIPPDLAARVECGRAPDRGAP